MISTVNIINCCGFIYSLYSSRPPTKTYSVLFRLPGPFPPSGSPCRSSGTVTSCPSISSEIIRPAESIETQRPKRKLETLSIHLERLQALLYSVPGQESHKHKAKLRLACFQTTPGRRYESFGTEPLSLLYQNTSEILISFAICLHQ